MLKLITKIFMVLLSCIVTHNLLAAQLAHRCPAPTYSNSKMTQAKLNPVLFQLAKKAYLCAKKDHIPIKKNIITIIDYTLPSSAPRMWVIDLTNNRVLLHLHVAQGKNSGLLYATKFSDQINSDETSLGLFLTGKPFQGSDGYSLRLIGLEPGFNDNAMQRDIVIHGATYVSQSFMDQYHRIGRSWGCPAVNPKEVSPLIHLIKNGSLVFSYAPQESWLRHSKFLNCTLWPHEMSTLLKRL